MRLSIFAAMLALAGPAALRAQEPIKLNLRCPAPCSFRQGESIWLDLDFTASTPKKYTALTNATDREMAREEFTVTPQEGAVDPVAPYLRSLQAQVNASSFRYIREPLSRRPTTARINLNQWIRFDRPGTFHVSVLSRRAVDLSKPSAEAEVPAQSNEIALQIVPADPKWQKKQLSRIQLVLAFPFPNNQVPDEVWDLCNLGTEAAVIEMARQIGNDQRTFFLYEFGLIRSPFPAEALREMERLGPRRGFRDLAKIERILDTSVSRPQR